jgi:hypothetical protein
MKASYENSGSNYKHQIMEYHRNPNFTYKSKAIPVTGREGP